MSDFKEWKYTPLIDNIIIDGKIIKQRYIDVTMEEHLEILKSPKKCEELGVDFMYERMIYDHQRKYNNFPPLPEINKDE